MDWTPSGWVREDGLPLPDDMDKIVGAHTSREGFDTWPAELRFDYHQYREAIVNRPASLHRPASLPTPRRRRRRWLGRRVPNSAGRGPDNPA
jgi:hypothetical protein